MTIPHITDDRETEFVAYGKGCSNTTVLNLHADVRIRHWGDAW